MTMDILFTEDAKNIDWQSLRSALTTSGIHDERSAKQLSQVIKQSQGCCFALIDDVLITARSVSDHTDRTYIADSGPILLFTDAELPRACFVRYYGNCINTASIYSLITYGLIFMRNSASSTQIGCLI